MKRIIFFIILLNIIHGSFSKNINEIFLADPTVYFEGGKYYLTGTYSADPVKFVVYESDNLLEWEEKGLLLMKGDDTFGEKGFWAPQIFKDDNRYFLTYTANEQTCLSESGKLSGPYKQKEIEPIDSSAKNIDSYLFKDDDGKYYLYHVRFNKGNYIWVAEFDIQNGKIKKETLKRCFVNTQAWENTQSYKSAPIMEGPTVIKIDKLYYLFYSANHFMSRDYAVGYAVSESPFGPWKKYSGNPVIHKSIVGENGSGHGDIFRNEKGEYHYVYHVHNNDSTVHPRKTRIVKLNVVKQNGFLNFSVLKGSVIKPQVK